MSLHEQPLQENVPHEKSLRGRRSHRAPVRLRSRRLTLSVAGLAAAAALLAGCASSPGAAQPSSVAASSASVSASAAVSSAPAAPSSAAAASSAAASAAASSAAADAFPVTVKAGNGDVTVKTKPIAIASLSPSATEMLYAIGASDQVTVVDKNSNYPADLPKNKVDSFNLNVEALTAYKPDLVITAGVAPEQQAAFEKLGVTMLAETAPTDLDGVYAQIVQLGQVTGHSAQAADLVASMKAKVAGILAEVPKPTRPLTYYYELDQTYYSVTSDTFIGSVLGELGLTSIADTAKGAAAAGGYPQLDAEFILKANPDYIFLSDTTCCQQSPQTVAGRDGWKALAAVKDHRVIALDDDIAARWSPRIVDLMQTVADALKEHPAQP